MKTSLTTLFSSFLLASVLIAPVAQAQQTATESSPFFSWLSNLVPSNNTTAGGSVSAVELAPLNSSTQGQVNVAAASTQTPVAPKFIPASPVVPVVHPAQVGNTPQPVVAEPSTVIAAAPPPRSNARRQGSAAPRVYTIEDIFGTGQTAAATVPAASTDVRVAVNTPRTTPIVAPVRVKKKVNMKTWKSGSKLATKAKKKTINGLDPKFARTQVRYESEYEVGTIVVDPDAKFLYLIEPNGMALRYGVGVGRAGFEWSGTAKIKRKVEWPTWTPPAAMRKREPWLPARMEGGLDNPLGARALYLYQGNRDTLYRLHGTDKPDTIGKAVSSGCIRLINDDIADLYNRVPLGTSVVVLPSRST